MVKAILQKDCQELPCQGIGFSRAVRDAKIRFRAGTSHCRAPDTVLAVAPRERVGQLLDTKYGTAEADALTRNLNRIIMS